MPTDNPPFPHFRPSPLTSGQCVAVQGRHTSQRCLRGRGGASRWAGIFLMKMSRTGTLLMKMGRTSILHMNTGRIGIFNKNTGRAAITHKNKGRTGILHKNTALLLISGLAILVLVFGKQTWIRTLPTRNPTKARILLTHPQTLPLVLPTRNPTKPLIQRSQPPSARHANPSTPNPRASTPPAFPNSLCWSI